MNEATRSLPAEEAADERLHQLWQQGRRVDLAEFLAGLSDLEPVELVQVLLVDQRERWQLGERVPAEAYLRRFPAVEALPRPPSSWSTASSCSARTWPGTLPWTSSSGAFRPTPSACASRSSSTA